MKDITIQIKINGYVFNIGNDGYIFDTTSEIVTELERYFADPEGVTIEYEEGTVGEEPINPPTDLSVTNTDTLRPTFSWQAVGANSYIVEIFDSAGVIIEQEVENNQFIPFSDIAEGDYSFRVKAVYDHGEAWSDAVLFVISIPINLTVPTNPTTTGLDTYRPTFSWDSVEGAEGYEIHASQGSTMTIEQITSDTSYTPDYDMAEGTHHWRVRAFATEENGPWTDVYDISISIEDTEPEILPAPTNLTISNTDTLRPTFSWDFVEGANEYLIHADIDNVLIIDVNISTNEFTPDIDLEEGIYYWRVRAVDENATCEWAEVESFTITLPEPEPEPDGDTQGDINALQSLYTSTNGDNWNDNTGWSSDNIDLNDSIYGVETAIIDGQERVISIQLNGSGTRGESAVMGGNNLTGTLPEELGNLTACEYFNVKRNYITGEIPEGLWNMTGLVELYLNGYRSDDIKWSHDDNNGHHPGKASSHYGERRSNDFTGSFSSNMGNLTNLEYLEFSGKGDYVDSGLYGDLPAEINNLTNLKALHMGFHKFTSWPYLGDLENLIDIALPMGRDLYPDKPMSGHGWPDWVAELTNLRYLWFEQVEELGINDSLPDLSHLTEMRIFLIDFNRLSGQPPWWISNGSMPNMYMPQLAWNRFTGTLQEEHFDPTVPMSSYTLTGSTIDGDMPNNLWQNQQMINQNFDGLDITGSMPQDLTHLYRLRNLRIARNYLTGPIPDLDWDNNDVSRVHIQDNYYTFADYLRDSNGVPVLDRYKNLGLSEFWYDTQKPIGQSNTYTSSGDVTIDDFVDEFTHANNDYQWQEDESDISGETDKQLITSNPGTYRLKVTNSQAPEITLYSAEITIE